MVQHFADNKFAWTPMSVLLELQLLAQGMSVPKNIELGTEEHLFRVFELVGGHVAPAPKPPPAGEPPASGQ